MRARQHVACSRAGNWGCTLRSLTPIRKAPKAKRPTQSGSTRHAIQPLHSDRANAEGVVPSTISISPFGGIIASMAKDSAGNTRSRSAKYAAHVRGIQIAGSHPLRHGKVQSAAPISSSNCALHSYHCNCSLEGRANQPEPKSRKCSAHSWCVLILVQGPLRHLLTRLAQELIAHIPMPVERIVICGLFLLVMGGSL